MLIYEVVKDGHEVIITGGHIPIFVLVFESGAPVLAYHESCSEALTLHVFIIADIILRNDEGDLSGREHNGILVKSSVFVKGADVVHSDKDIAFFIHLLQHLIEFRNGTHHGIVICRVRAFEGYIRVHDEAVEEDMGDL